MNNKSDLIIGIKPMIEALKAGQEIDKVMLKKGLSGESFYELLSALKQTDIPYQFVPMEKLNKITRKNHQGVIAFASLVSYYPLDELITRIFEEGGVPFLVILDGITDVRNFGAIARSAEFAGAHGIIIPDKGSAQVTADAIKTSAGSLISLPVSRVRRLDEAVKLLKESGLQIIAAKEDSGTLYYQADLNKPLALVMGSEDTGPSDKVLDLCDETIKIQGYGKIESLNVSVAAGVLLLEVIRQRDIAH